MVHGAEISPDYHQRSRVVGGRRMDINRVINVCLIPLAIEVSGQGITLSDSIKRMLAFFYIPFFNFGKISISWQAWV